MTTSQQNAPYRDISRLCEDQSKTVSNIIFPSGSLAVVCDDTRLVGAIARSALEEWRASK